jgi:hypothetical protein
METSKILVLLFKAEHMHHKNLEAILQYDKIEFEHINDITKISLIKKYKAIYSPIYPIDINTLPPNLQTNTKYIFGPHFSVFPQKEQLELIINENTIYIQPSEWANNIWKYHQELPNNIKIKTLPFCVNTTRFFPIKPIETRTEIFVYYKNREPAEINYILNYFITKNKPIKLFHYRNGYNENDYINTLQNAKYGIWVDAHESQGFALEEALSCDVPLLIWNIKSLNQEYGSNYPNLVASTIPYWDTNCGETFYEKEEFIHKLKTIEQNINNYKPREFILNNLSMEICQRKFIELIGGNQMFPH